MACNALHTVSSLTLSSFLSAVLLSHSFSFSHTPSHPPSLLTPTIPRPAIDGPCQCQCLVSLLALFSRCAQVTDKLLFWGFIFDISTCLAPSLTPGPSHIPPLQSKKKKTLTPANFPRYNYKHSSNTVDPPPSLTTLTQVPPSIHFYPTGSGSAHVLSTRLHHPQSY